MYDLFVWFILDQQNFAFFKELNKLNYVFLSSITDKKN